MKDFVRRVNSFVTFELPVQAEYIDRQFKAWQYKSQLQVPDCEAGSTRQQLIARFWFTHVKAHFAAIVGLPLLLLWPVLGTFQSGYVAVMFIVSLICFMVLLFAQYWPVYCSEFLPRLEAVISSYRGERLQQVIQELRQQLASEREHSERRRLEFQRELHEKLAGQQAEFLSRQETLQSGFAKKLAGEKEKTVRQQEEVKKCRQAQLSNFALTLVFFAFVKNTGNRTLLADDHTADLLRKLYGVDRGSLRSCLGVVTGSVRIKDMGERKRTEMRNRFVEAVDFLEAIGFRAGVNILHELEMKICGRHV